MFKSFLTALLTLIAVTPALAQRDLKNIPDPDPEIERKSFQVADGFEVNLFAADPLLAKPIQMNFDAAGRLWVASSEVYPQIQPGQEAKDKILVLEDTDGDGRADKTTVFADGLLIPTGVEPGDGGVYVANSTELLHLRDSDGDGRADTSRIVLSGFGTEDTHHILHTLRWGHDGMLYFNQSIYIHSHIETPWGVRRLGGGGIWQFRPESWRLEVFCRGFVNPWGHHLDDWGQSFATDGAYGEGINYVFPGATFVTAPGATRILRGLNPGSPKHCGLEIVGGRHLPDDWQGNMLTNDFRGNRVCRFVVTEDGSGYASREMPELIKTSHVAFRPIDIKMGPDGAIYIADWYNPIIQHGEVDFRDPRRDHTHGRIWRVTAKGRAPVERPKLVGADTESLLEALKAPEQWTRHFAKRVLKERGAEVVPALASWVQRLDPADPALVHHQLEALWVFQSLDVPELKLLEPLLHAKDHRARAAATRVAAQWQSHLPMAIDLLAPLAEDEHPRVRLEAIRALAALDSRSAVEAAMRALDQPVDQSLDFALWLTARESERHWLPVVQQAEKSSDMGFDGDARRQTFALLALGSAPTVRPLTVLLREGNIPAESQENALATIGSQGGPRDLALVLDVALDEASLPPARRAKLLDALARATRQRKIRPDGDAARLDVLLSNTTTDESLRTAAARVAGLWQVQPLKPSLIALAQADATSDSLRQAALEGLVSFGDVASREAVADLCQPPHPTSTRVAALAAFASLDLGVAATRAPDVLQDCGSDTDTAAVFRAFLERKDGPRALAAALAGRELPLDVAKLGVRLASISGRQHPELVAALTKAGAVTGGAKPLAPEELRQMVQDVLERGDAARGEDVFRRPDANCFKCHAIAGAGGLVGPDLLSIGASAQVDYLIESLFDPNKAIKEGYHSVVVATNDGRVLTGVKVRQTGSELVLRNAEDREVAVPLSSIEEQKPGGSLMPVGLTDPLTRGELIDLVRFLSELGKVGPFAVGKDRVARRWEVLQMTPEAAQQIRHAGLDKVVTADSRFRWSAVFSKVSGALPVDVLQSVKIPYQSSSSVGFVRAHLDVSTPGKVQIALNSANGLKLWLDGTVLPARPEFVLDLSPGRHALTFAIDLDQRAAELRCELQDVAGSKAQAQFAAGN